MVFLNFDVANLQYLLRLGRNHNKQFGFLIQNPIRNTEFVRLNDLASALFKDGAVRGISRRSKKRCVARGNAEEDNAGQPNRIKVVRAKAQ